MNGGEQGNDEGRNSRMRRRDTCSTPGVTWPVEKTPETRALLDPSLCRGLRESAERRGPDVFMAAPVTTAHQLHRHHRRRRGLGKELAGMLLAAFLWCHTPASPQKKKAGGTPRCYSMVPHVAVDGNPLLVPGGVFLLWHEWHGAKLGSISTLIYGNQGSRNK
ncbi:unnamed protein product [Pleuronectes platessa]|uniref:Uncharacterized protein n=1 Tax=Pleuronectes platessa TaxID=8262 RepID=A0A9N7YTA2_PLEPL|nr:unnamed protein product [Pleuronectes platessa]